MSEIKIQGVKKSYRRSQRPSESGDSGKGEGFAIELEMTLGIGLDLEVRRENGCLKVA